MDCTRYRRCISLSVMTVTDQNQDYETAEKTDERISKVAESRAPLHESLSELVRIVEGLTPSGMLASILILGDDRKHLLHGAGPSLPAAYNEAINGIEIGPEVGSCGTAAYHDKTVAVYDIATNPLWANFKDLALEHGLRACWSTPIHGPDGKVLGTFANYYRLVRDPSPRDLDLTTRITSAAAQLIERARSAAATTV